MRQIIHCLSRSAVLALALSACGGGSSDTGALLNLAGNVGTTPKPTTAKLTLMGSTDSSPGIERTGFRTTRTQTDGTTAIPAQQLSFKSDSGGSFNVSNAGSQIINTTTANTNNFGQATSEYFVPASTGTATVRACVRRSTGEELCRIRDIQVRTR